MISQPKMANALVSAGIAGGLLSGLAKFSDRSQLRDDWADQLLRAPLAEPDVIPVVTADGAHLRVHAYGPADGEPIVLSHGWSCRIEYWNPQINVLSKKFRVIAYDQRGHGESDFGTTGKADPDMLGDDLAAVLDAAIAPGKKAVIVGHSMGGMSIMSWAGRHPEQIDRYAAAVMLMNTASDQLIAETTVIPLPVAGWRIPGPVGRAVIGAPLPLPRGTVSRVPFKFAVMSPNSTPEQVDFCHDMILKCKSRTRGRWGRALADIDITAALENLNVPTVVVAGELDRMTPAAHSERLAAAMERNGILDRLVVLPGVGHMGNVEAIQATNDEITRLRTQRKAIRRRRRSGSRAVAG